MRISTSIIFERGLSGIQDQFSALSKIQQQLATGRRVLTPSDDPIASARAQEVSQSQAANDQFVINMRSAQGALELEESILSQTTELLQGVRVLAVNAGNPALNDRDRASLATDLQGRFEQLLGLANSTDGNGQFIFSGFKGSTIPFSLNAAGGVNYNGDQGQRLVQIGASRQIVSSSSGAEVFQSIRDGNGTFVTAANYTTAPINTGTGVISPGVVTDPTKFNSAANNKDFTIKFAVDSSVTPSATTYDIIDNVTNTSLLTGLAPGAAPFPRTYASGAAISLESQGAEPPFDFGAEITISGAPADGDTFTIEASRTNQDIFSTLSSLIQALNTPTAVGTAGNTRLTNDLNTALSNLDLAQDNLLTVRAKVGATLNEVDAHRVTSEDLALQFSSTLSELQDLDLARALSESSLKQVSLEAAQKSFLRVQGLSLFNFLQ